MKRLALVYGSEEITKKELKDIAEGIEGVKYIFPDVNKHSTKVLEDADMYLSQAQAQTVVVVTYCEYTLLRIQRRMRYTSEEGLEGSNAVTPKDIELLHVSKTRTGRTRVREIELSKRGVMLDPGLEDLFSVQYNEVFN